MARNSYVSWVLTAVCALVLTGAVVAQSPAADAPASAAPTTVEINRTETVPAAPVETKTDINVNRVEETTPVAPASTSSSTTVWGFDGKTVLIGGALLLGIILIAVAAAGRDDRTTTVVR